MVSVSGTVFKGSESGKAVKAQGPAKEVGPDQVAIKITHCGLCGTDLHYKKADMVLGHEGVGLISHVGSAVRDFKVGDRVGWGYNHNSCHNCSACTSGRDTFCDERQMYGVADLDMGGFSDVAVLNHLFVHRIPEGLSLSDAAPLQCGGATVFGAIFDSGVKSWDRVGVVGIGGLGHLAIQYLSKMGCDVVAFSGSDSKKDEALSLGAHEYVASKQNPKLEGIKPVKYLFVTTGAQPDWELYFGVVEREGVVVPLTVSPEEMKHPYMPLLTNGIRIQGSLVATRHVHRKMLEFSARIGVKPMVEELPMTAEGLNEAMARLENGDVRYRFVLVHPTNKA